MTDAITPFTLSVPESELEDLRRRLAATRWPEKETVGDWTQGSPPGKGPGALPSLGQRL